VRTAAQTITARFFSGNPVVQFNTALRNQVISSSTPPIPVGLFLLGGVEEPNE
jgi:hypothetical protein